MENVSLMVQHQSNTGNTTAADVGPLQRTVVQHFPVMLQAVLTHHLAVQLMTNNREKH